MLALDGIKLQELILGETDERVVGQFARRISQNAAQHGNRDFSSIVRTQLIKSLQDLPCGICHRKAIDFNRASNQCLNKVGAFGDRARPVSRTSE